MQSAFVADAKDVKEDAEEEAEDEEEEKEVCGNRLVIAEGGGLYHIY